MKKPFAKSVKKDKTPIKGHNALNDPEERKKFRKVLDLMVATEDEIANRRATISATVKDLTSLYGLDPQTIRRMVKALRNRNYTDELTKNHRFEEAYEHIVEGGFRNDPLGDTFSDDDM